MPVELLERLRKLGVRLWVEDEQLRYSAPRGALAPELRAELAARKMELVAFLREAQSATDDDSPLRRTPREHPIPLSFAQERLWLLDRVEPDSPTYNMHAVARLSGALDAAVLKQCFDKIVERHEVLRTTFPTAEGRPMQAIAPFLQIPLPLHNLEGYDREQREAPALRLAAEEARRPFDLARGPLLRGTLMRLDGRDHILALTMHHIVCDGLSVAVWMRELGALYEAFRSGEPSPLPDLPIQYADFARWQRHRMRGKKLEGQLAYWRSQLAGCPPLLNIPLDRPRPTVQTFSGAKTARRLPRGLSKALRNLSGREGATVFMTLLAALKLLLHRYTSARDIVVGTPVAGRDRAETETLIGCFLNTLPLRTELSGDESFRELLGRVRHVALDAQAHQDLPFERLLTELRIPRDPSHTPLFQVLLNMLPFDKGEAELSGLALEFSTAPELGAKFDMTLYVEDADAIGITLVYNADLFDRGRIAEMLTQYELLLSQIVAAPDLEISRYGLVTDSAEQLLPNPEVELPEPDYGSVADVFANWAKRSPEHPAVRQGGRAMTYGHLAGVVREIVRELACKALQRGDVVALVGPRSFGLVAGMTSILSAGGVLVTLDANLPLERQRLILREAGAKYLLYVGDWSQEDEWLQADASLTTIRLDANDGTVMEPGASGKNAAVDLRSPSPDDPAYIFFTSGTTGVPKGVLGTHKGLSHFLTWERERLAVGPEDRCAQLTNLSFDVVLRDVFLPLTSGATLCLPEASEENDPYSIVAWLEREKVSLLHAVPTLTRSWLSHAPPETSLRALRWVLFAGEALTNDLIRRWRETFPLSGRVGNLYGPTETTLAKCFYEVPSEPLPGNQPVGRPLPQVQALVLDSWGQLCGVGVPGEIAVRTPFLTRGYVNSAEQNDARFVPNPFRDDERDLLFHTGDWGRYLPDGSLQILGRLDAQVKIRGLRVEPEEVSAVLSLHEAVEQCVVVSREDASGENYLVAYVASPQGTSVGGELMAYLRKRLPPAMVPSSFKVLNELPVTPNGKIDREALPEPDGLGSESEQDFLAPRGPVEQMLAAIWSEVLGVGPVGVHDDFFELGGDSLMATQVIHRVRDSLQTDVRERSVFERPTVAHLATVLLEDPDQRTRIEKTAQVLTELHELTEEEAEATLGEVTLADETGDYVR